LTATHELQNDVMTGSSGDVKKRNEVNPPKGLNRKPRPVKLFGLAVNRIEPRRPIVRGNRWVTTKAVCPRGGSVIESMPSKAPSSPRISICSLAEFSTLGLA